MIRSLLIMLSGFTLLQSGAGPAQVAQNVSTAQKKRFFYAVVHDDLQTINDLLENGVPVDVELSPKGNSALGLAAEWNKLDVASLLIASGADVNRVNNRGATALTEAAGFASPQMLKLLLDNGADINYIPRPGTPEDGIAALAAALQTSNDLANARFLIENGAIINSEYQSSPMGLVTDLTTDEMSQITKNLPKNSLLTTIFKGAVGKIERKAIDERLAMIREILPDKYTALYESPLFNGNADIFYAFYLPEDKNIQTSTETEIFLAILSDKNLIHLKAKFRSKIGVAGDQKFNYLVDNLGLWSLPKNPSGSSAQATLNPFIKIVPKGPGLLLNQAAKKDDTDQVRAILKSVYETASSNPKLSKEENKANGEKAVKSMINLPGKDGKTALHHAVLNNNVVLVGILLYNRADPTLPDNTGKGPLDYAVELSTECKNIETINNLFFAYKNRVIKHNERSEATFQPGEIVPNSQGLLLVQAAKNDDTAQVRAILKSVYETFSSNPKLSKEENKAHGEKAVELTINLQDEEGKTALHHAVLNHNYLLVGILLNNKANATLPDNTGKGPLDYAVEFSTECKNIETINRLLFAYQNRAFRNQAEAFEEQNKVNSVSSN